MARADVRLAAGAGLISVSLLMGGPCVAIATAHPGHGNSDNESGQSDRGRDSNRGRDSGHDRRGGNDRGGRDDHRDNGDRKPDRDRDGRQRHDGRDSGERRSGHDRGRGSWDADRGSRGNDRDRDDDGGYWDDPADRDDEDTGSDVSKSPTVEAPTLETPTVNRSAARSPSTVTDTSSDFGVASVPDVPEAAAPVPLAPAAAATAPGGGGGGASAGAPPVTAPPVTFGNGRTPGQLSSRGGASIRLEMGTAVPAVVPAVAPLPAAPLPAPVLPAPAAPMPAPAPLVVEQRGPLQIDGLWAPLQPAFPSGLLFGIAGLVLMPMAGVWLGYRQARAARAASQLVES